MKEIKTVVKAKRDSKVISTLAVILLYCLETSEFKDRYEFSDSGSAIEEDKSLDAPKKELIIDGVQAVAAYILGGFDWPAFSDLVKEFAKEDAASSNSGTMPTQNADLHTRKPSQDVVGHLVKFLSKSKSTPAGDNLVLEAFFSDQEPSTTASKRPLGISTYFALASLALNIPGRLEDFFKIPAAHSRGKELPAVKSILALGFLLRQAGKRFSPEACKELISDLSGIWVKDAKLAKEIAENQALLTPLFEMSGAVEDQKLLKMQATLLSSLPPALQSLAWLHLKGSPLYKISVLNEALSLVPPTTAADKHADKADAKCILYAYAIEDVLGFHDLNVGKSTEFLSSAGKLLLLADRLDLIYVSAPGLSWLDERLNESSEDSVIKSEGVVQREGGMLRVLLKVLFLAVKHDVSEGLLAVAMLRYLIFRGKSEKKRIKEHLGLKRAAKPKSKSKRAVKYNLLDIILRRDLDSMKQYSTISEFYTKKVIGGDVSVLDPRKIQKSAAQFGRETNFFEHSHTLMMYILCELFHLMHFELLGITSYKKLPTTAAMIIKAVEAYRSHQKLVSGKYKCLVQLLTDLIKSDKREELASSMLGAFEKLSEILRPRIQSCLPDNGNAPNLGNVWSALDLEKKEADDIRQHWEILASSEESKAQMDSFERFKRKWHEFVKSLMSMVKADSEILTTVLLKPEVLGTIQPYILLLTGYQFCRLDQEIIRAASRRRLVRGENAELAKFRLELLARVRAKFAGIGVPKSKIGRQIRYAAFFS